VLLFLFIVRLLVDRLPPISIIFILCPLLGEAGNVAVIVPFVVFTKYALKSVDTAILKSEILVARSTTIPLELAPLGALAMFDLDITGICA